MGPPAPDRMCPNYRACRDARYCWYQDREGRLTDEGKRLQRLPGYCKLGRRTEYIKRHSIPRVADPLEGIYPEKLASMKNYQV